MRVTNFMTHNQSLNNINRNMRHLQRLYEQSTSTKEITRPSQDPLIASRALRFRTRIDQIGQHLQNAESGQAWMNVSESAMFNMVRGEDSLFAAIRDEITRAMNNPTGTLEDVNTMMTNLQNLKDQIGMEMNQTFGGRFVFAGWRTNQPPVLMRPQNHPDGTPATHVITQTFNLSDMEHTYAFRRPAPIPPGGSNAAGTVFPEGNQAPPIEFPRVHILKLPFRQTTTPGGAPITTLTFGTAVPPSALTPSPTDPANPASGAFHNPASGTTGAAPLSAAPPLGIFRPDGTAVAMQRRYSTDMDFANPGPDEIFYIADTGELILGENIAREFNDGWTVRYEVHGLQPGDLNPLVYFDTWSTMQRVNPDVAPGLTPPPDAFHWPRTDHPIYYEFNLGTNVQINSLAHEVFTATMFADLRRMMDFISSLTLPDRRILEHYYRYQQVPPNENLDGPALENAVNTRMGEENAAIRSIFGDRLNNMLRLMDTHQTVAVREHTSLGTRMRTVESMELRLEQAEGNYTSLKSDNEDVDMTWTLMLQSRAEYAFQNALRVIANNVQLSLINFIR